MKLIKLNTKVILALLTAVVIATSVPVQAEEIGFRLNDSIRNQIFQELKANVEDLYRNGNLLVPNVDASLAARIANNNVTSGFGLSKSINADAALKDKTVGNIN